MTLSATYEVVSLVWMEFAMFVVAALIYILCVGGAPAPFLAAWFPAKKKVMDEDTKSVSPKGRKPRAEMPGVPQADHTAVLKSWQQMKTTGNTVDVELSSVVHSMQKLGKSTADIMAELKSGLQSNPELLPKVVALPTTLLRDDAVQLLDGTVQLLEEFEQTVDIAVYAGLMGAQLRRRDYEGAATTAQRVASEALTPKMRSMLVTSAAHRGRLDEVLGHLRQMPVPADGERNLVPSGAAIQVLALAVREQRAPAAASELKRIRVRVEAKHFDELVVAQSKRSGGVMACRELIDAGVTLNLPKAPSAYQALASALAASGQVAELKSLLEELEGEVGPAGIAVSEPLAMSLLAAAKTVRDSDMVARIVELHRLACAGAPGARVLSAACLTLIACEQGEAACDFYEEEIDARNIKPDATLTTTLLSVAAKLGRQELEKQLSELASTMRPDRSAAAYGAKDELQRQATSIKNHARERDLAGATRVFNQVRSSGVTLTPMIYNCFLDACVQCGDLDGAKKHFQEMKQLNFVDVVGYNTVLKAYLTRGHTQEAHDLVKEMVARGLQANKVTYNELLHAKVLAKDRRGIWSLVDEMREAGVKANSVTCSILLKSLTAHSHPADAQKVIALVDEVEDGMDEVLFSSVIEACIRIRQLDVLSDLMKRYRQKAGFVNLTAPTYGSMIKAYGQSGDVARVRELWREMEERGVKPTSITLGCMTEALVANQKPDEAWELLNTQLETEERKVCINTVIYSTVLKGFAVARRIDKVFSVYKEMRSKSIPCNTITYNTMLDACAKCCTMDRTSNLLEDMRESNVEPDIITYSTIVKGYCLEGDVDRAFQVLEDMKSDDKFAADEIMYNSILDGCAKQHRVDDAMRLLEEMKATGVVPSNYTLSILVKLLGHARRLSQAFQLVEELSQEHGFRPNVQVYTCLVQACLLNRRLERALTLHDTMVADAGCWTDEKFYAVLARGCLQLHQPLKAIEVVRAAYQLSGHSLATPARSGKPVGVEARALDEVVGRLGSAGKDEQQALASLRADLLEQRGVTLSDGQGAAAYGKGKGKGKGYADAGQHRGQRGGANRNAR